VAFDLPYGTYDSTFDEKGRVIIPAPLRDRYRGPLVVTQGSQLCVWVMTPEIWQKFQDKLERADTKVDPEEYELLQYLHILPARVVEIDKNSGRIPVAPAIRTYAGLNNKKCLIMSAEKRLEIWDSQYYYDYLNEKRDTLRAATNKIGTRFFKFGADEGEPV